MHRLRRTRGTVDRTEVEESRSGAACPVSRFGLNLGAYRENCSSWSVNSIEASELGVGRMAFAAGNKTLRCRPGADTVGDTFPIDALGGPGTYVCNHSGHLLRVFNAEPRANRFSSAARGRSASRTATKISTNPHLGRSSARALAGVFGLHTNF